MAKSIAHGKTGAHPHPPKRKSKSHACLKFFVIVVVFILATVFVWRRLEDTHPVKIFAQGQYNEIHQRYPEIKLYEDKAAHALNELESRTIHAYNSAIDVVVSLTADLGRRTIAFAETLDDSFTHWPSVGTTKRFVSERLEGSVLQTALLNFGVQKQVILPLVFAFTVLVVPLALPWLLVWDLVTPVPVQKKRFHKVVSVVLRLRLAASAAVSSASALLLWLATRNLVDFSEITTPQSVEHFVAVGAFAGVAVLHLIGLAQGILRVSPWSTVHQLITSSLATVLVHFIFTCDHVDLLAALWGLTVTTSLNTLVSIYQNTIPNH
eukprot:c13929_g1_i1.p1 GENE.c13929_g1_i1~~c13929_g1_i1.p1  ORF type:complete len:337 (+),score=71.23 c13929_g1_i1:43-1011(+)